MAKKIKGSKRELPQSFRENADLVKQGKKPTKKTSGKRK
jgi:hypothetical protein